MILAHVSNLYSSPDSSFVRNPFKSLLEVSKMSNVLRTAPNLRSFGTPLRSSREHSRHGEFGSSPESKDRLNRKC